MVVIVALFSCQNSDSSLGSLLVSNSEELSAAIAGAEPGDEIVLANGNWEDVQIRFAGIGTEKKPITLRAETPGEVIISGQSNLKIGGEYLIVQGLHFEDGATPSSAVIEFQLDKEHIAFHCQVTECVIKNYNQAQRNKQDLWVRFHGRHNQLDHCYLAGKSYRGPTIRVNLAGIENIKNYHRITNNHFGPRPPKGGPSAEIIPLGSSYTSMTPSPTLVANNLFDECNGEVEIIYSKSNFNEFRNNVFYKSEGSLVTRNGNYCTLDGNYFIGDKNSNNIGGIRLIGTGHWVTNNYFYQLNGEEFRSPLAVMNGIPKSPLNRYIQVTDLVVAHNTWIECSSPWHFGVGSNVDQKDVLPASEIRSARPIRTTVANNLIYNSSSDVMPVVAHDKLDGINFQSNVINNQGGAFEKIDGLESYSFEVSELQKYVFASNDDFSNVALYSGFDFESISQDLLGNNRKNFNSVGAISNSSSTLPDILNKDQYGPTRFSDDPQGENSKIHIVTPASNDLISKLSLANAGDIIQLAAGIYEIKSPLKIDKPITIQSDGSTSAKAQIVYSGAAQSPLFEMNPKGELKLEGIKITGEGSQFGFASLSSNMSSVYNLHVDNCEISQFDYVLKAYKYYFSEFITFTNSSISNCKNGIELSEEIEDKGEYNAENIRIVNCKFDRIDKNVIDYYRGGYYESTVGGNLIVSNSDFTNCGRKEANKVLLNTYGIINVDISGNTFRNNPLKLVALLWGAKNNSHSDNTISNSGKIQVGENLKLNLLY